MKKISCIVYFLVEMSYHLYAQDLLFINFPTIESTGESIDAKCVLKQLNWNELKAFCDSTEGHYARIDSDEKVQTYSYIKQGREAYFELVIFDGKVLEYQSEVEFRAKVNQVFDAYYFDRELWYKYLKTETSFIMSKWVIPFKEWIDYPEKVIQAYYKLLGFNAYDEYGWICEYSAAGFPPAKRRAIIDLINYNRRDFILKLLDHPNIQTKLYAADALIYLDIIGDIQSVDMLNHNGRKKTRKYIFKYSPDFKLSKSEWKKIFDIRDANLEVKTCKDGTGSYRIYSSNTKAILSEESIKSIYENYTFLKTQGYLWR